MPGNDRVSLLAVQTPDYVGRDETVRRDETVGRDERSGVTHPRQPLAK